MCIRDRNTVVAQNAGQRLRPVPCADDPDGDARLLDGRCRRHERRRPHLVVLALVAERLAAPPVSYTHLDVYKRQLQDIATLTGGQLITEEMGRKLDTVQISDLGRAGKVVSTKDDTTIVDGKGDEKEINGRVEQIKVEIDRSTSDYDKEKLQERLAKLSGGVAIIRVGAATEVELKEKKHRVEDALSATRAAVEEGIVPGGGVALLNALPALDDVKTPAGDITTGVNILRVALEACLLYTSRCV